MAKIELETGIICNTCPLRQKLFCSYNKREININPDTLRDFDCPIKDDEMEWTDLKKKGSDFQLYECSHCGKVSEKMFNYCPHCGYFKISKEKTNA